MIVGHTDLDPHVRTLRCLESQLPGLRIGGKDRLGPCNKSWIVFIREIGECVEVFLLALKRENSLSVEGPSFLIFGEAD